jgi:formylglycine-generating enzyme required for sulfatase activity
MPRIFVSHAHTDNAYCREYVAGLRAHGCYVWYDEHNLGWGALRPTIEREMPACQHFVAILTPASVASDWVNSEIDAALDLLKDGTLHTLTFVVAERCTVPLLLRRWKRIEGADGAPTGVAEAVARTLNILGQMPTPQAAAPAPTAPPIPADRFPPRFASLGFTPRTLTHAGKNVELIVPPLCAVPAGPFRMGSDKRQDASAFAQEKPQHEVNVAAFQLAKYPVTVAEYACFVRDGHAAPTSTYNKLTWQQQQAAGLDHPVVNVSWHDAVAYASWLAQLTGQSWRLPTEAEWEKAARYDPTTRQSRNYPWGDAFDQSRANTSGSGRRGTTPVDAYPSGASPCGALDMAGNVWEWTSSLYQQYPYNASDGRERTDSTGNRVLRGGSWAYDPALTRAACRSDLVPSLARDLYGFRVVVARAAPGS